MLRQAFSGETPRVAGLNGVVRVQAPDCERACAVNVPQLQSAKRVAGGLLEDNRDQRHARCGVLGTHEVDALETLIGAVPV